MVSLVVSLWFSSGLTLPTETSIVSAIEYYLSPRTTHTSFPSDCAVLVAFNSLLQIVLYAPLALFYIHVLSPNQAIGESQVQYAVVAKSVAVFLGKFLIAILANKLLTLSNNVRYPPCGRDGAPRNLHAPQPQEFLPKQVLASHRSPLPNLPPLRNHHHFRRTRQTGRQLDY